MIKGKARLSRIRDIEKLAAEGMTCAEIAKRLDAPTSSILATAKAFEIPMTKGVSFGGKHKTKPMRPDRFAAIQRIIGLGASDDDVSLATACKPERVAQIRAEMGAAK